MAVFHLSLRVFPILNRLRILYFYARPKNGHNVRIFTYDIYGMAHTVDATLTVQKTMFKTMCQRKTSSRKGGVLREILVVIPPRARLGERTNTPPSWPLMGARVPSPFPSIFCMVIFWGTEALKHPPVSARGCFSLAHGFHMVFWDRACRIVGSSV